VLHPSQFKQDPSTGVYSATYTLEGHHAAAAMNMPQHQVFDSSQGITSIHDGRVWGGDVMTAMSVGTKDDKKVFTAFPAKKSSAAVLTETGLVVRGHFGGDSEGMIKPSTIHLDTTSGPWLDTDAAQSIAKHNKTAAEVSSETFESHPSVQVDGQTYALIKPDSAVGKIINTYGGDKSFFGGMYSKGHHVVDDQMLVSQEHYNELHKPLTSAMQQTEKPLVFMVRSGKKPTSPVNFSMSMRHGTPQMTEQTSQLVASKANEEKTEAVRSALSKMRLAGEEARVQFSAPETAAATTAGEFAEGGDEEDA